MEDFTYCQVVTTIDSQRSARALSQGAVEARLAACGQLSGPITSTYWWEGEVETTEEWRITFKTTTDRYAALELYIREHHSYDVPEVLCSPVSAGNPAYLEWLATETRAR